VGAEEVSERFEKEEEEEEKEGFREQQNGVNDGQGFEGEDPGSYLRWR
jgi:hypothetical protein